MKNLGDFEIFYYENDADDVDWSAVADQIVITDLTEIDWGDGELKFKEISIEVTAIIENIIFLKI